MGRKADCVGKFEPESDPTGKNRDLVITYPKDSEGVVKCGFDDISLLPGLSLGNTGR